MFILVYLLEPCIHLSHVLRILNQSFERVPSNHSNGPNELIFDTWDKCTEGQMYRNTMYTSHALEADCMGSVPHF